MTPISTRPSIGGDTLQARRRGGGSPKLSYVDAVKIDHPEVFWPLDDAIGSLTARDLSGHSHVGTVEAGHQTLLFGVPGYTSDGATALRQTSAYSGSDIAGIRNTAASVGLGNHSFTMEFAAARVDVGNTPILLAVGGIAPTESFWGVYLDSLTVNLWTIGNYWSWPHGVDPSLVDFHHYGVSYDSVGSVNASVDGVDAGAATVTGSPAVNLGEGGVYANGDPRTGDGGPCILADVAVYNHSLTAAQFSAHVAAR